MSALPVELSSLLIEQEIVTRLNLILEIYRGDDAWRSLDLDIKSCGLVVSNFINQDNYSAKVVG